MKKISAILLALVLVLSMTVAMAQTVGTAADDTATITISNASKGETYKIYKLFDATVTGTTGGSIAYTGDIPAALTDYFEKDTAGNVLTKDAAWDGDKMSADLEAALKTWAATATVTASAESDGSTLQFVGLDYGYYVVTTTQGEATITVTSTNPTATIVDKNSTAPITPPQDSDYKKVDDANVSIGDTVTYTIEFGTANFEGDKKIIYYTIADSLPDFLTDVTVTSIIITDDEGDHDVTEDFVNNFIQIDWVDEDGNSLYTNGANIKITYTATVDEDAAIAGDGNKNVVTITYTTEGGDLGSTEITDEVTIKTYAIAIQKVDQAGNPLAGATFQFPFACEQVGETNVYVVTDMKGAATEITTGDTGLIIIKGVEAKEYTITETKAPDGYNKLTTAVKVTATETSSTTTSTTTYLDENGDVVATEEESETEVKVEIADLAADSVVVVNKTGSSLPSTGGMGTTIFYVVGSLMMAAAIILLASKKIVASGK